MREEPDLIRVAADGSITIPGPMARRLLGDDKEDLEDFGAGGLCVVCLMDGDEGTSFWIYRDRRKGAVKSQVGRKRA